MFDPYNWYWLADDGRVYASKRQLIVDDTDADYAAWAVNFIAPPWPRDDAGNQTDAALQETLAPYHTLFVNLAFYTADVRWRKEQSGLTLTTGMKIKTDDRAQAKITGVYDASLVKADIITPWHATDGRVHDMDAAEIEQMNYELLTHINNCFSISAEMLAGIEAGTITTREQIDAAFAAPMTQARRDWMRK